MPTELLLYEAAEFRDPFARPQIGRGSLGFQQFLDFEVDLAPNGSYLVKQARLLGYANAGTSR